MSTDQRQNILIVGGGAAGSNIAKALSASINPSKHNLILISPRPFYLHLIGSLRAHVTAEGNFDERIQIPYDGIFKNGNGKVVVASVTSIVDEGRNGGHVELDNGEEISYAALVLATGSRWEGLPNIPVAKSDIKQSVDEWRAKIEKANSVLIVGGGAIGIETAGEIKEFYPAKKVTLVHGQEQLLNSAYSPRYRSKVERAVKAKGIDLILNDVVPDKFFGESSSETNIVTKTGQTLQADLLISARGPKPNTAVIGSSLGEAALNAAGYVRVEPTLQLPSHPRIFAAGDIIDFKEQKQAMKVGGHAGVVAPNVLAILNGQTPSKKYKGSTEMIALTIGLGGLSYFDFLWGIILGSWVTGALKSKDLIVNMTRSQLGL